MTISIEVNGLVYENFDNASVYRSVDTVSGKFSFETTANIRKVFPIGAGAGCTIRIGQQVVMVGYVDTVSVNYSPESHSISITGRDRTADLNDSTIGPGIDFSGPITLENICRKTLDTMGLSDIAVYDRTGGISTFDQSELVSAEIDKNGFEFLESYARQRQVFLMGDGAGNIMIARSGTGGPVAAIQNVIGKSNNNVLEASYSDNREQRFSLYSYDAQQSPASIFEESNEVIANQTGQATDGDIRETRRLYQKLEESGVSQTASERAAWEANIRRSRGKKYSAKVQGFYSDSARRNLWTPNQIVSVNDDFTDIHANMMIWSVEYSYSIAGGSVTRLECAPPDALSLEAQEPVRQKKNQPVAPDLGADSLNE